MDQEFRYHRPGLWWEFYTSIYNVAEPRPSDPLREHTSLTKRLFVINPDATIVFARDEIDIRGYLVNITDGYTIGMVEAFLADKINAIIPYTYVRTDEKRLVVVPTSQLTFDPGQYQVVLEGEITALRNAPPAQRQPIDAHRADFYWGEYRRRLVA